MGSPFDFQGQYTSTRIILLHFVAPVLFHIYVKMSQGQSWVFGHGTAYFAGWGRPEEYVHSDLAQRLSKDQPEIKLRFPTLNFLKSLVIGTQPLYYYFLPYTVWVGSENHSIPQYLHDFCLADTACRSIHIHCTLYIIHYTLYIIHYSLYIIHYTLYIIHYSFINTNTLTVMLLNDHRYTQITLEWSPPLLV